SLTRKSARVGDGSAPKASRFVHGGRRGRSRPSGDGRGRNRSARRRRVGGGHAIYFDAGSGRARNLDCFVAVPGLDASVRPTEPVELEIPFGAELVHYTIGAATCGVPGIPAGLATLHGDYGRVPWARLVEPALRLARTGVDFPPAHAACLAMLAPVMTMREGERIYSPGGRLLPAGS